MSRREQSGGVECALASRAGSGRRGGEGATELTD